MAVSRKTLGLSNPILSLWESSVLVQPFSDFFGLGGVGCLGLMIYIRMAKL